MKGFKKGFSLALMTVLLASCGGCMTGNDSSSTPEENVKTEISAYKVTKTIADFKYGIAKPYDKYTKLVEEGWTSWLSRTFSNYYPEYSYTPAAEDWQKSYMTTTEWYKEESAEDCNYYTVYPSDAEKTNGTVSSLLRFYIPPLQEAGSEPGYGKYPAEYTNYLDLRDYDNLAFLFSAEHNKGKDVAYKLYLKNYGSEEYEVFSYKGKGGKRCIDIDLTKIAADKRDKLEYLKVVNLVEDMDKDEKVVCKWFKIEAGTDRIFNKSDFSLGGIAVKSEYLGNMFYTMCGAYSGSGFYDTSDGKWKMWYGAGVPEQQSTDNVYYTESTDPERGWSKPVRIMSDDTTGYKLIDESGKLRGASDPIGYGGDPCVVKVNGTYYMYFSGLEWDLDDGTYKHWNKIYLATSTDGKTWTCVGAVVDTATGGSLGYGSGAPSVVYHEGKFWLYYYSQSYDYRYPNEPGGLVLKQSTDGINFDEAISIDRSMSSLEVRYVPELFKWIGTYYEEEGQFYPGAKAGVRIAFSEDGIHWDFDHSDNSLIAQDLNIPLNHNPGFLGTEHGYSDTTLYCMYGANDLPLTFDGYWFSSAQYDARQMEFSKLTIN